MAKADLPSCSYAASDASIVEEMNAADAFGQMSMVALKVNPQLHCNLLFLGCRSGLHQACHVQVVEQHPDMPGADVASMYSALLGFSGTGAS